MNSLDLGERGELSAGSLQKRCGIMTAALALFGLDCLSLAGEFWIFELHYSMILNVLFHLWALWGLIQGVRAASERKKLETAQMFFVTDETQPPQLG